MHRGFALLVVALVCIVAGAGRAQEGLRLQVRCDAERVGMGRPVTVCAHADLPGGQPAEGCRLLPYVNGRRWGAHEWTDAEGNAVFQIPLPNPGRAEIVIQGPAAAPAEEWIWAPETRDNQTVYLRTTFPALPTVDRARLWIAVDNAATVWLNGRSLGDFAGWINLKPVRIRPEWLRTAGNTLAVRAVNGDGPAGVLMRLELTTAGDTQVIATKPTWRAFDTEPAGWPERVTAEGRPAASLGAPETSTWSQLLEGWPSTVSSQLLFAGTPMPKSGTFSEPIRVEVEQRDLALMRRDERHRVGMQWEPWFTPHACAWQTAQAVPLMGYYWSWNPDVTRQHMIWLMESGVDFLVVDWTNHLWGCKHWDERPDGTNEIIHATTCALETLAVMRDEGWPVPQMVLYPGLNNGPETTMEAVNEELAWIYNNYIRNPRFHGLFVDYLGKPLVMIHNGGGAGYLTAHPTPPVDDTHFTVRWENAQNDTAKQNEFGFWSWMDGALKQAVVYREGEPECMTVSTAFFSSGGWTAPTAFSRRGGWTYAESFRNALGVRPRFVELHQFNEFAGQPEGGGYGPNKDVYVDSYDVERSDDIEPVSLTAPAYRGSGGWGYYFLNLTRALVDLYKQPTPETTVVVVEKPARGEVVKGDTLDVSWTSVGKPPSGFSVEINGRTVAENVSGTSARVDVRELPPGLARLTVTAHGTRMRYALSYTEDSLPLSAPRPASAEVEFTIARK